MDFVFVLQDGDELSVPRSDLLDAVYVTEAFLDPASQRSLPTPGGILDAGLAHHDHPAVVFTNRDWVIDGQKLEASLGIAKVSSGSQPKMRSTSGRVAWLSSMAIVAEKRTDCRARPAAKSAAEDEPLERA